MVVTSVDLRSFLVLHPLKVALQSVEAFVPQSPVRLDPGVDLAKSLRPQPVDASLGIDPDIDEAGVAEHAEVLRDGRLAHRKPIHELAHWPFAVAQQVEDAAAIRFGEELEGGDHER
jgi:hypothetical protein